MQQHIIPTKVLQEALNYLSGRPYAEVSSLIQSILNQAKELHQSPPAPLQLQPVESQQEEKQEEQVERVPGN